MKLKIMITGPKVHDVGYRPYLTEITNLIPQIAENTKPIPQIVDEIRCLKDEIQPGLGFNRV